MPLTSNPVNRELIRAGVARYQDPKAYSLSGYTARQYRITEREALKAKRGLWLRVVPWAQHNNNGMHPTACQQSSHG